ncbi:hypothetical protein BDF20DRAFT_987610, partial [Mycotypha africana]|uniref:uncharacterized protein n=1 Tax=Mycotypha africana TaxID=64632 RepID=UPI00230115CE
MFLLGKNVVVVSLVILSELKELHVGDILELWLPLVCEAAIACLEKRNTVSLVHLRYYWFFFCKNFLKLLLALLLIARDAATICYS